MKELFGEFLGRHHSNSQLEYYLELGDFSDGSRQLR